MFAQLADFEEHRYEAREALKSALLYPVILLVVAVVSLVLMTVFVLPAFAAMLQDLRAELPWTTKLLLTTMAFVESHLALLVAGIVLAAAALFALLRHEEKSDRHRRHLAEAADLGPTAVLCGLAHPRGAALGHAGKRHPADDGARDGARCACEPAGPARDAGAPAAGQGGSSPLLRACASRRPAPACSSSS